MQGIPFHDTLNFAIKRQQKLNGELATLLQLTTLKLTYVVVLPPFFLHSQTERSISKRLHCPSFFSFCLLLKVYTQHTWVQPINYVDVTSICTTNVYRPNRKCHKNARISKNYFKTMGNPSVLNIHNSASDVGFFFKQAPLNSTHTELTISKNSVMIIFSIRSLLIERVTNYKMSIIIVSIKGILTFVKPCIMLGGRCTIMLFQAIA